MKVTYVSTFTAAMRSTAAHHNSVCLIIHSFSDLINSNIVIIVILISIIHVLYLIQIRVTSVIKVYLRSSRSLVAPCLTYRSARQLQLKARFTWWQRRGSRPRGDETSRRSTPLFKKNISKEASSRFETDIK